MSPLFRVCPRQSSLWYRLPDSSAADVSVERSSPLLPPLDFVLRLDARESELPPEAARELQMEETARDAVGLSALTFLSRVVVAGRNRVAGPGRTDDDGFRPRARICAGPRRLRRWPSLAEEVVTFEMSDGLDDCVQVLARSHSRVRMAGTNAHGAR